jgi:hypothetical protein
VGAHHGPELGHELRVAAVDLAAALGEALGHVVRLDVLDDEHVGAGFASGGQVVDHALEGAAGRAHALHRLDLALDREDRLDLECRADPCLRRADAPPAAEVLERVDREDDAHPSAQGGGGLGRAAQVGPVADRVARRDRHQPRAGSARVGVQHLDSLGLDPTLEQRVARLLGGVHGARDAA